MNNNSLLTDTEKTLLDLLANALFGAERPIPENTDWDTVWKEAYMQAVAVLSFSQVNGDILPGELHTRVRARVHSLISESMRVDSEHARLHGIMEKAGIPYTIIKGFASVRYYPDFVMRSMGDVDFLISLDDLERASEALIAEGFVMSHENHVCHRVFTAPGIRYEMHFEPAGIPHGEAGAKVRRYLADTVEKSTPTDTAVGRMRVPSTFHHGLIILIHTSHHLTGEGIGLRHLCDWAVFINSMTEDEFVSLFRDKLESIGMWRFACLLTQTVTRYLGCPAKKWAGEEETGLVETIIKDVFEAGNFGQKDTDRAGESLLISDRGKSGIGKHTKIGQFIDSCNQIVYQKWKISKKIRLLIPLGWLIFGGRYFIRMLMGKRPKIHPVKIKNEAQQRIEIYKQLNLFETGGDGK